MRLNAEVVTLVLTATLWPRSDAVQGFLPSATRGETSPLTKRLKDGAVFDYVVVGAGGAGAAAAARAARGGRVLLVEAGGDPGLLSKIPNAAMALMGSDIDWFYEGTPNNKSCLSLRGRRCRLSRGRCLGGSTSINYMLYTRASPHDYDFDVPNWSWNNLKPYFLRYEGLRSLNRLPSSSYTYHNTSGEVTISPFEKSTNPWNRRIVDGLMSLNFPFNPDVNARTQIGVSHVLGYVNRGERVSTATAYLHSHDVKRKLVVAPNMRCTAVIIDANNTARGVTVVEGMNGNKTLKFYAKREVVLSAGTIGSAQLLMLSGIGNADHLQTIGVPVRADLPVGDNMSDHVLPLMLIKIDQVAEPTPDFIKLGLLGLDIVQWATTRSGPLASLGVTDVVGFANTKCYDVKSRQLYDGPECSIPTSQIIFAYIDRYIAHFAPQAFKKFLGDEVFDQILDANANSAFIVVSPILLRPKSKGWIRLASKDPLASPVITPNYLDEQEDVDDIVKSIRIIEQLVETPVFRRNNASLFRIKLRECPDDGRAYWECYVRHMTSSAHHAVGTVQLGRVVDERLRVRGIKRLRVGDVSVLPEIPRGNTAAVAIAIGERMADFLLEDKDALDTE